MCIFKTLGEFLSRMSHNHILGVRVKLTCFFPLVGSTAPISTTLLAVLVLLLKLRTT